MNSGYLQISGLVKTYPGATVPSVDRVDLSLAQGQMLALLGPSGCGKTTTLRMIAGLIEPTAGTIHIDGRDVTHLPVHKRGLGMVFQSYALFPHLTVAENVAFGLEMRSVSRAEIKTRVAEALDMVQLGTLAGRKISQLSGGQQQRIALARALVVKPAVLLLDEPLSNLDAKLRDAMRTEIREIQKNHGITAVFVTHDQDEALSMADTVAVMSKGRVEQIGPPETIYRRPATRFAAEFIGRANFMQGTLRRGAQGYALDVPGFATLPLSAQDLPRGTDVSHGATDPAFDVAKDGATKVATKRANAGAAIDDAEPFVGSAAAQGRVTAMIRPHRVTLVSAASTAGASHERIGIGQVVQRAYTGEIISYSVRIGDQVISAEMLSGGAHDPVPGDKVGVHWSAADLVIMPESA